MPARSDPSAAPPSIAEDAILAPLVRKRDGFQMAAGWMRAGHIRPGRRLKAPEEGNRGQQGMCYGDLSGRAALAGGSFGLFWAAASGILAIAA
jgi:hypothetical protein